MVPTAYKILCVRLPYSRSSVTQLLNKINTRYGWVVKPFPTGTFTLQDTLSFAQRDNAPISGVGLLGAYLSLIHI